MENPNSSDPNKIDIITVNGVLYTHKQIEMRDGKVFMRLKRRNLERLYGEAA